LPPCMIQSHYKQQKPASIFSQEDLEKGVANSVFGKGQFLFVVQQLDQLEVNKLAAYGYLIAALPQIAELASKSMQVPHKHISSSLDGRKAYSATKNPVECGTHITAFPLRLKIANGFGVLVPINPKKLHATFALPFLTLTIWQRRMLGTSLAGELLMFCRSCLLKTAGQKLSKTLAGR
jgi:hypothetical protein